MKCGRASGLVKVSVPKAHLARLATSTSELAAAEVEYASLGAKIKGLQAQSEALTRALSGMARQSGKASITKPRTDAIVDVLMTADTEMTINDVIPRATTTSHLTWRTWRTGDASTGYGVASTPARSAS
jgi:hypothetical protein